MPVHFSFTDPIRFFSISSPIGTHIVQAVGTAYAIQYRKEKHVVLASCGDGGTSSLGFHSGLNFAGVWKSPVIFLCQNNQWAISCPSEKQTASDGYAVKAEAYGMPGVLVDGNDLLAVYQAVSEAAERARKGGGPTLIEARTFRMEKKDPVKRFEKFLAKRKLWTEKQREQWYEEAMAEVDAAAKTAQATPRPALETIFSDVYATLPAHLRRQGQQAFDIAKRHGEAEAGDGAFPL
jgi:TPP-dependent pyruvate/acetoin dehydrogenase alpha subunit